MNDRLSGLTHELVVSKRIQETSDTCSLVFAIPTELKAKFSYQPGQFVTLNLDINGEKVARSYSLSSSPITDQEFQITIKKVIGGKASGYLVEQVQEGDRLAVTPPAGNFCKPSYLSTQAMYAFAAGSGITPIFSILKTALALDKSKKFTLFYCSRNEQQIIFYSELAELTKKYGEQLIVHHVISQASESWPGLRGRIMADVIKEKLNGSEAGHTFICGPEDFMNMCQQSLEELGFEKNLIHRESFNITPSENATSTTTAGGDDERILIGDKNSLSDCETVIAITNGESHEIKYDGESNILDLLINNGVNAPYSCMDGACMACLGKVREGTVYQEDLCILTEENVRDRESLTCQAKPISKKVVIDYDDI